ncbi:GP155-like protein [Mya arenaria]|uniref:GP155-like protein n=1 Tax=Mya arenaria TaxID=6604 RepID=A0ABY7DAE4_MYAAR|nr:GP155-like protein [Mya arenaria]
MAASGILATNLTEIGNLSTSNIMSNLTRNTTTHEPAALSIDNLYPAIFQCFAIIMAGYIAGRANLITEIQGKGIGTFVGKFCLPALLFRSMVVLDFSQVNWYFLLGIAISKTAVFIAVAGLTLLIKRPVHLGYAVKALYEDTHPEYLQYIYLVAPISLIFLNPIGFVLLEIHRRRHDTTRRASMALTHSSQLLPAPTNTCHLALHVAKNVLSNAFSASALFYLGLNLVGKVSGQLGLGLVVPLLLIMAKTLLMPLITWQVVGALELHGPSTNDSRSLSMYAFLYGTFPTAPSVFIYASHFSVAQDIIATGMVVCTFLSAPLMFVSAKMMTVVVSSEMDYKTLLLDTSFDLSVVSLVFNFVMLLIGVFSTRCFAAVLSIVLYLLHCRSLCFVLRNKGWMYIFALGFPMVGTGMLLIFGDHHLNNEIDPSFHYGTDQSHQAPEGLGLLVQASFCVMEMEADIGPAPTVRMTVKLNYMNNQVQESGDAVGVKVKRQPLSDEYQTDRFIILLLSLQVSIYRFRTYNKVFCGTSLCDWLQEVGLVHTRGEAVSYGRTLLRGRVICHVTEEHDFHDMPNYFNFR